MIAGFFAAASPGCAAPAAAPPSRVPPVSGPSLGHDPQIISGILGLVDIKDTVAPSNSDFTNTALQDVVALGTPEGFQLRNRFLHLGVSLAEAVAAAPDPRLLNELTDLARWDRNAEIRSVALNAMARRKNPDDGKVFEEALNNTAPEVRFAALEALEMWDLPGTTDILQRELRQETVPLVQIGRASCRERV